MADFLSVLGEGAQQEVDKYIGSVQTLSDIVKSTNEEIVQMVSSLGKGGAYKDFVANMSKAEQLYAKIQDASVKYEKALLAEAKAEKIRAEAQRERNKAEELMQKIADNAEKRAKKEEENAQKLTNAYEQLKKQYTAAANEAKRLGAELGATNPQFIAAAGNARKLYDQLLGIEKAVGQAQRQVGQYNIVGASFNQLLREAPAFTNSFQTGLLALSNNIPIFADAVKRARSEGASLGTILKTIGGELISPIGLITAAVSIFTIWGDKIFTTNKALNDAEKANKKYYDSLKSIEEGTRNSANEEIARLRVLEAVATDTTQKMNDRKRAVDKLQELYPDYLKNIKDEAILNGSARDAINEVTEALLNRASAQAAEKKFAAASERVYDLMLAQRDTQKELTSAYEQQSKINNTTAKNEDDKEKRGLAQFNIQEKITSLKAQQVKIEKDLSDAQKEQLQFLSDAKSYGTLAFDTIVKSSDKYIDRIKEQIKSLNTISSVGEKPVFIWEYNAALLDMSDSTTKLINLLNNLQQSTSLTFKAEDIERVKEYYDIFNQAINGITDTINAKQEKNFQERQAILDKQTQSEIDAVNASSASQQEKADRIAAIEKNAAAQKEEMERRKQQIERRTFIVEKAASLARIVIDTQEKAAKIQATAAVMTAANNAPGAANALAQLPLVYASGAVAAGIIAAQILTYAKGTPPEGHTGGAALAGEAGKELVIEPSGRAYWVDKPTYYPSMEKGTHVIPEHKVDMVALASGGLTPQMISRISGNADNGVLRAINALTDTVKNKTENTFIFDNKGHMKQIVRKGNMTIQYLSKNIYD